MRSASRDHGVAAGVFTYNHEQAMAASWISFRVDPITMNFRIVLRKLDARKN